MSNPSPAPRHAAASHAAGSPPERTDFIRRLGSSRFNYWFGYVANLTLVAWMASHAWVRGQLALSPVKLILYAVTGLLSWTLSEYLLHRYVYHVVPSFLSEGHALHHDRPRDLIGVPWYLTTIIVVAVFYAVTLVASPPATGIFMAMNWFGYVMYCLAHHGSHHFQYRNGWLKKMKRHHLIHHAHPAYNWGFTTALWDRVFRTHYDLRPPRDDLRSPRARSGPGQGVAPPVPGASPRSEVSLTPPAA
jgi:dihydroceramide fatty acyl 2-hydroxylase